MSDYIVVWSGAKERAGECFSLLDSRLGQSSLAPSRVAHMDSGEHVPLTPLHKRLAKPSPIAHRVRRAWSRAR